MNNVNISAEQIIGSARAGVAFLNLETTMIPGNMKQQLAVLEAVLQGVGGGHLQVVSPQTDGVESVGEPADTDGG